MFSRELALAWRQRLTQLCGRDVLDGPPPRDEWLGYRSVGERARAAFAEQSTAELRRLAAAERAWLLAVPVELARPDLVPSHAGGRYLIYDLRQSPQDEEEP